ncbi:MAG: hypothetical protein QOE90_919 [Thermoplasmata archaeon]|jgi:hypothetical protein|nr:hypothetical protein [Thermoplasmata archaeon]
MIARPLLFAGTLLLALILPFPSHNPPSQDPAPAAPPSPDVRAGRVDANCNLVSGFGFTVSALGPGDCLVIWTPALHAANYTVVGYTERGLNTFAAESYTTNSTEMEAFNSGCGHGCPAPFAFVMVAPPS